MRRKSGDGHGDGGGGGGGGGGSRIGQNCYKLKF